MRLAAPTISGVLSSCSRQIWLDNLVHGAAVDIDVGGVSRSLGLADWPGQFFDLPAGFSLVPGQAVRARQQRGADSSDWSKDAATVQSVPSTLPKPVVPRPIMGCSAFVVVEGLIPGSDVNVSLAGLALGSVHASGSHAGVHLAHPLNPGVQVDVTAVSCGPSTTIAGPPTEPHEIGALPMPGIPPTLHACQRLIAFDRLIPGTTVVVTRGDGKVIEFGCESTSMTARFDPPMTPKETLRIHVRATPGCEIEDSPEGGIEATSGPPDPPFIDTPLCPGSFKADIAGLVPSAQVELLNGGVSVLAFDAPGETTELDLAGVTLQPGDRLTLRQGLCGTWGPPTAVPAIVTTPEQIGVLRFADPVPECALVLRVQGVVPGSLVSVFSAIAQGGRIGHAVAAGSAVDVGVIPALIAGDTLTATSEGCISQTAIASVKAVPGGAPSVARAVEGDTAIDLVMCRPGSLVDVLLDDRWAGSAIAVTDRVRVDVRDPLAAGQRITTFARWCAEVHQGDAPPVARRRRAAFARATTQGINVPGMADAWKAGRVQAIAPLPNGDAIVGTESSGLWIVHPAAAAEPMSESWGDPHIHVLCPDPNLVNRWYAGTDGDVWFTDQAAVDPVRTWNPSNLAAISGGFAVRDVLVIPGRSVMVLATSNGLRWTPTNPWPPTGLQTEPAVSSGSFVSLAQGPNDSVIAYRTPEGLPAAVFVGTWGAAGLSWQRSMIEVQNDPDSRRAQIEAGKRNGALASAPSDRHHVYLAVAQPVPGDDDHWYPVLHSSDGGLTWVLETPGDLDELRKNPPMGHQAERNLDIAVHPANPATVIIGGCRAGLARSDDWSASFGVAGYPDFGTPINTQRFHSDVLCFLFDPADPSGNTIWVGSDGGVFRSTDMGKSWDERYNQQIPTIMFDQGSSMAPTLSANPAAPEVLVGGTQDNGFVYCPGAGREWRLILGGDGYRAKFVTDDVAIVDKWNDGEPHWLTWDGSTLTDRGALAPSSFIAGGFLPWVGSRVPQPDFRQNGGILIAVFGTEDAQGRVFGLFDTKPGSTDADRLRWDLLGTVPNKLSGLAAFDGRTIVATTEGANNTGHYYRLDTASGPGPAPDEFATGSLINRGPARWPSFIGPRTVLAVDNSGVVRTDDLVTWRDAGVVALPSGTRMLEPFAVDAYPSPHVLYGGDAKAVWSSNDDGRTWTPTDGLPRFADCRQLEFVAAHDDSRRLVAGTWNWSAWVAILQ